MYFGVTRNWFFFFALLCGLMTAELCLAPDEAHAFSETLVYYFQNTPSSGVCPGTATANQTSVADILPGGSAIDTHSNGPVAGGSYYHFNWTAGATGQAATYADDMFTHIYNADRTISSLALRVSGDLNYNYGTQNATVYAKFFDVDGNASCQGSLIAQTAEGTWPFKGYGSLDLTSSGLSYTMAAGHRIRVELWVKFAADSWPGVRVTYSGSGADGNKLTVTQSGSFATIVNSGTDPANSVIGPGGPAAEIDAFTLGTVGGSDIVEAVTVTLASSGMTADPIPLYNYISAVSITSDDGSITYGSTTNAFANYTDWDAVVAVPLTTPIVATTTPSPYKVSIRAKTHAAMPTDYGTTHEIRGRVTAISSSTNPKGYGDLSGTTVTINNSPGLPSFGAVVVGDNQIALNWTYPADAVKVLLLQRAASAVTDTPVDMVTYTQGSVLGSSVVAYAGSLTSLVESGLAGGNYYYRLFAVDAYGNYSTPGLEAGPYTMGPLITIGNGTDPSDTTIPPGASATALDSFTLQSSSTPDAVMGLTVSTNAGWPLYPLSKAEITSDDGSIVYGSVVNPDTDIAFVLWTPIAVDTTPRQYKVRVTPKTSAELALDTYVVGGRVTSATTYGYASKAYQDTSSATVTIDKYYHERVFNMSLDTVDWPNTPLYSVPIGAAFSVRARFTDQVTGAPITGLTSDEVVIYKITNMTTNSQLSSGTHYTSAYLTELGNGVYDRSLYLYSGAASVGDVLQIEMRGIKGTFVDAQWIAATQYAKVGASGSSGAARYVEIQPSTAGNITALSNGSGFYTFKMKFINATGAAYNPGGLTWSVSSIKDNSGATPPGSYTVSASWNSGGWYECSLLMLGATLTSGNGYYIVISAASGNYVFTQSMGLTARAVQTTPAITVAAFTDPVIDITAPIEGSLSAVHDSGSGYVQSQMTIAETFTDNESAVQSCEYTLDGGTTWNSFTSVSGALPTFTCSSINTGVQADGTAVSLGMRAVSGGGKSTLTNTLSRIVDAAPPVDGVLTVVPGYKKNAISWTAATDSASGLDATDTYEVYSTVGSGIPLDCVSYGAPIYKGPATSFTHTGLMSGWNYGYRVCAYDKVRNRSAGASGLGVTFTDATPPAEVYGTLQVSPDSDPYIAGTFTIRQDFYDSQTPVTSCKYTINNGSNWYPSNTVTDLGGGNFRCTTGNITGTNGLAVTLMMKATSDGGESTPAALLARTVDSAGPADGTLTVTPGLTVNRNDLSWTSATDSGSGLDLINTFRVVYQTGNTPPPDCSSGTQIYSGPDAAYAHTGLLNLTTYSYRVCAYDKVGNASAGATGSGMTGRKATAAGTAAAVPFSSGFSSGINVIVPYADDSNGNNTYSVDYKLSADTTWLNWGDGAHSASPFMATVGLMPGQTYDIRVTYHDPDGVTGTAAQLLSNIRIASDKLIHNSMNANKKNYWSQFGGWGMPGTQYGEFICATCHEPRAWNIAGIRSFINLMPIPGPDMHFGGPVNFLSKTGPDSFGDDSILRDPPPPASKICEVCHTQTYGRTGPTTSGQIHRYNQTETGNHANSNGMACTSCHTHNTGFKAPW